MDKITILLVEDNEQILLGNARFLERHDYAVETAVTLADARSLIAKKMPDLIVLDIMLPDGSGLDFMRELRKTSDTPVLLLTGLTTPEDIVRGLSEGGDDYLAKPYDFSVLLARIRALLRRAARIPENLEFGKLVFNILSGRAFVEGEDLRLTPKEFSLLMFLAQNRDRPVSLDEIGRGLYGNPQGMDIKAFRTMISRLREKISPFGPDITAIRGVGYRLDL
jgi:DNA-binding response OmpR family regulator